VCQLDVRPLATVGANGADVIVCVTDVTASRVVRDELSQRATFDDLTGCHNRASTLRELARLTAAGSVGVVYIDLDGFKPVNDRYGHAAGDEVLALVAARLRAHVRQLDVVGRVGGDEFVVLYAGVGDSDTLARLAARLQGALEEPTSIAAAGPLDTTASLGSVIANRGDQPEAVLAAADAAMYVAKRSRQRR
jgi:diguanylate cyclase (GGDEF)-like protein